MGEGEGGSRGIRRWEGERKRKRGKKEEVGIVRERWEREREKERKRGKKEEI